MTALNDVLSIANQKLEDHGSSQKEFLNVAAHELRTPTQAILGYAEIMKMNPTLSKYLDSIVNNAKRLYRLVEDILDTSRIENKLLVL